MLLLSHPLGNANVRQAALAFAEAGALAEFWTCLSWDPDGALSGVVPARVATGLARRAFPPGIRRHTHTAAGWREAGRHLVARLPAAALRRTFLRHERGPFSVDAVFRGFDRAVARRVRRGTSSSSRRVENGGKLDAVYAYEDAAEETFRAAAERGWHRFYDLPIGYWRAGQAIFAEEAAREPAWAPTLTGRADSPEKLARKDRELAGADAVFVASRFTEQTLREHAPAGLCPAAVHVVPYGAPDPVAEGASALANPRRRPAGHHPPLRVLFVGSLGQRKGLSYLLEAMRVLGPQVAELTLLGMKTAEGCTPLDAATRVHRWIPSLPHAGVLAEMAQADVLVFPSLFEGFGLVILEAFSRGLPVIATAHTALPDLLSADGAEGFVVPVRSAGCLAEKLELLAADPARLAAMKRAALARAAALRWEEYRRRLVGLVEGGRRTVTSSGSSSATF